MSAGPALPPRSLAVVSCAVLDDEVRHFIEGRPHVASITYVPQGLHNEPPRLQRELQAVIERVEADPQVQAIALVYGLCSRGIENLRLKRCRLAVARAHDCITLMLGSREKYDAYQRDHPGTYWYSPGWIKAKAPPGPDRMAKLREEWSARFDPEEVEYLVEMEQSWISKYNRAAYVEIRGPQLKDGAAYTRSCADCFGWQFESIAGEPALLVDLLEGRWDAERFLVVQPGQVIRMTADASIIAAVPEPQT